MKVTRYREHRINTGDNTYESQLIGARVEHDTETDEIPEGYSPEIFDYLNEFLDDMLAPEVQRVVESGSLIKASHVYDYYQID